MMTGSLSLLLTEIVEAKSAPSKVKNINLGADILETNVNTSTASSIYYGTYNGQPIKWKTIGFNGNGVSSNKGEMTLLANDTIVSNIKYNNTTPYKNSYADSDLQTQIDSLMSSVLFIYTGGESRIDTLHTTTDENVLKTWNVTLQGGTGFAAERKSGETENVKKGEKLTVNVTNCGIPYVGSFLTFNQIAAMLVDANGTVEAYGKITDNVKEGKIEVTVPNDNQIKAGIYTLKVFAEQLNSNNQTSYATNMADIAVTIEDALAISVKKEKQKTKWWLKIFN